MYDIITEGQTFDPVHWAYWALAELLPHFEDDKYEKEYDQLLGVLDQLAGWCAPVCVLGPANPQDSQYEKIDINAEPRQVKRTERGWAGHHICANRCRFRRNTLLEFNRTKIVVSTMGLLERYDNNKIIGFDHVGTGRYFETLAWHALPLDRYLDIDVDRPVTFASPWQISEIDKENEANEMHERVVSEIKHKMQIGQLCD